MLEQRAARCKGRRARALAAEGRMAAAGLSAFEARRANRSGQYSYEQRPAGLVAPYSQMLASSGAAKKFFARTFIGLSARGELIPQFRRRPRSFSFVRGA
jgi:hypothetical protein